MRFRVGIFDIAAAVVVVIVMLLPARTPRVAAANAALDDHTRRAISRMQARLSASPGDGVAAEALAEALTAAGASDWALRAAGSAAAHEDSPTRWQSLRAVSATHADRIEIPEALRWAERALAACGEHEACPSHEEVRLRLYVQQLTAGLESGIDPKVDPAAFREAINRGGVRQIRLEKMDTEPE